MLSLDAVAGPLPEEQELRGYLPLQQALAGIDFKLPVEKVVIAELANLLHCADMTLPILQCHIAQACIKGRLTRLQNWLSLCM